MKKISEEDINDIFDIPGNMSHLNSNEDSHDVSYSDLVRDSGGDDFSKQVEKVHSTIVESNQDCVDKLNVESLEWRDRVSQIAIRVNAQYYSWKRAIDLFIGLLAQFKYEKPATKQDGLVYKHMGDMIRYFSQLESSHKSVEMIMKNLDNAFECLSRQVTISMPGRDHEDLEKKASDRMSEKNVNNKDYVSKTDLSDSDKKILSDLDTVSSSKPVRNKKSVKTGKVDWNGNF